MGNSAQNLVQGRAADYPGVAGESRTAPQLRSQATSGLAMTIARIARSHGHNSLVTLERFREDYE